MKKVFLLLLLCSITSLSFCLAIDECGRDSLMLEFLYNEDYGDVVKYETDTAVYYLNVKTCLDMPK